MKKSKNGSIKPSKFPGKTKEAVQEREMIFPEGVAVFSPNDNAPDFVKAKIVISLDQLNNFVDNTNVTKRHKKYGEQLTLNLKESKGGKLYLDVDMYGIK